MLGDIKDLYSLEKKKDINDKVLRDMKTLFDSAEEDYYKPIRTDNGFSSNYIQYESTGDKDKTLPLKNILIKLDHI